MEQDDFMQLMPATEEDLKQGTGRKSDEITKRCYGIIDSMNVGEKFYIKADLKPRCITYCNREYHKKEGNTKYFRIKAVIKNEKYAVVRIA